MKVSWSLHLAKVLCLPNVRAKGSTDLNNFVSRLRGRQGYGTIDRHIAVHGMEQYGQIVTLGSSPGSGHQYCLGPGRS